MKKNKKTTTNETISEQNSVVDESLITKKKSPSSSQEPIVRLRDVLVEFGTGRKTVKAVKGVTFDVYQGETFGLVGESGSGKTTIGRAIMGIQPISDGTIYFKNRIARGKAPDLEVATRKIEHNIQVMLDNQNATTTKINNYLEEYKRVYYKYLHSKFYDFKTKELKDYPDQVDRRIQEGKNISETKLVNVKKEANIKFITTTINDNLKRLIKTIRLLQKTIKFVDGIENYVPVDVKVSKTLTNELKTTEHYILIIKDLENKISHYLKKMNHIRDEAIKGEYTSISLFFKDLGEELKQIISIHKSVSTFIAIVQVQAQVNSALVSSNKHRKHYLKKLDQEIKLNEEAENHLRLEKLNEIHSLLEKESITNLINKSPIFKTPTKKETRDLKKEMQMIFQDPASSLNDRMPVEQIIGEGLNNFPELYKNDEAIQAYVDWYNEDKKEKEKLSLKNVKTRDVKHFLIAQMLEAVGMLPEHLSRYPHEFSGGQRQRIGIARALVMKPEFIVADEPISALDASIRAQVINLLTKFQEEYNLTYIFIAHDLSIVRFIADRIAVLYHGDIVELADAEELFHHPLHPYTKSLLSAVPLPDPEQERKKVHFVYEPDKEHYDYLVDFPVWHEISKNHFVYANTREVSAMKEKLKAK